MASCYNHLYHGFRWYNYYLHVFLNVNIVHTCLLYTYVYGLMRIKIYIPDPLPEYKNINLFIDH